MDTMISWMIILHTRFVAMMMTMIHLMVATLPLQSTEPTTVRNCGFFVALETTDSAKAKLVQPSFGSTTPYHQDSFEGSGTRKESNELANPS